MSFLLLFLGLFFLSGCFIWFKCQCPIYAVMCTQPRVHKCLGLQTDALSEAALALHGFNLHPNGSVIVICTCRPSKLLLCQQVARKSMQPERLVPGMGCTNLTDIYHSDLGKALAGFILHTSHILKAEQWIVYLRSQDKRLFLGRNVIV